MGLVATAGLGRTLARLRERRGFDADVCIAAKVELLVRYAERTGLRGAVVGVSGGVDSAVTLGLLARAAARPGSPLRRVVAAVLPIFSERGATTQDVARRRGLAVAEAMGVEAVDLDLTAGFHATRASIEAAAGHQASAWAEGQLVSTFRTPALYYLATLLTDRGDPAAVFGTTNRDEGAYLGFFGKASDGMVDVQPISDLHKREVFELAARLGVPAEVIEAPPRGDVYDGRDDEAMIGASYDLVELHAQWRGLSPAERRWLSAWWTAEDRDCFARTEELLEARHRTNAHKYVADSVAIHLDVYERVVPGGWRRPVLAEPPPFPRAFVAPFELPASLVDRFDVEPPLVRAQSVADLGEAARLLPGVLEAEECAALVAQLQLQTRVAVGRDGRRRAHDDEPEGSLRASVYDPRLAELLWRRLAPALPPVRCPSPLDSTDHGGHPVWRAVGLNPLLRFIAYRPGGLLVPHHDAGFDFGDGRRHSLASVLLVLTPPGEGGALQLLLDPQRHLPVDERVFEDGTAPARPSQVLCSLRLEAGSVLVFDHRLPHALEPWRGPGERVVLRTDLVFERAAAEALPPVASEERPPAADEPEAWRRKVLADPFYRHTLQQLRSRAAVEHAGYFDDGAPVDAPVDPRAAPSWLGTPLSRIAERLAAVEDPSAELVVLLSTGGFWPVHVGHVEMMELARAHLEAQGVVVLGGLLAPDHDDYARHKCGPQTPSAARRVQVARLALADHPWLEVDPWPSLHAERALNFTTIIERLQAQLSAQLRCHRRVEVVYVFGGDNARFALSFLGRGRCVCVPREGYLDVHEEVARHPAVLARPSIQFTRRTAARSASREIRAGDERGLPPALAGRWREPTRARTIVWRDEGSWAVEPWRSRLGEEGLRAYDRFRERLLGHLREAFGGAEILRLELAAQRARAAELTRGHAVISLDPCIPGDVDLGVSRCFSLGGGGPAPVVVARPGHPPLSVQLERIPAGRYVLLDDDRATGLTIETVRRRLPSSVEVERVVHLADDGRDPPDDLVDARDFLAGAREAGLVVRLPDGRLARVPYVLPYVHPSARLSAPAHQEVALSVAVWALNVELFRGTTLRVADASPGFRALCDHLGFDEDDTMHDVATWHHERIRRGLR